MASISKQPKEMQERHRRILTGMLKLPENRECADCRARNPTWASTNLGVFLCIRCSGLHRQIGVHITKVKSCTMDLWEPEQVAFIQKVGNAKAKLMYEARLPSNYGKPAESEDSQLVLKWIRVKYEQKKFAADPATMRQIMETDMSKLSGPASTTASNSSASPSSVAADASRGGRSRRDRKASDTAPTGSAFGFVNNASPTSVVNEGGSQPISAFGFVASPAFNQPAEGTHEVNASPSAFAFIGSSGSTPTTQQHTGLYGPLDMNAVGAFSAVPVGPAPMTLVPPQQFSGFDPQPQLQSASYPTTPSHLAYGGGGVDYGVHGRQPSHHVVDESPILQPLREDSPDFSHIPQYHRMRFNGDGFVFDPFDESGTENPGVGFSPGQSLPMPPPNPAPNAFGGPQSPALGPPTGSWTMGHAMLGVTPLDSTAVSPAAATPTPAPAGDASGYTMDEQMAAMQRQLEEQQLFLAQLLMQQQKQPLQTYN